MLYPSFVLVAMPQVLVVGRALPKFAYLLEACLYSFSFTSGHIIGQAFGGMNEVHFRIE